MRPVERGPSPQEHDFEDYRHAFPALSSRFGPYCSFCERRVPTNLAVEHIQPKALVAYAALIGRWDNFLLACVNCNSTKRNKDVILADFFLPDRDNTAFAFAYAEDGTITPAAFLSPNQRLKAEATLALCGLDRRPDQVPEANQRLVATDRHRQRMEAWAIAKEARDDLAQVRSPGMIRGVVRTALGHGHFSIWMTVFANDPEVRSELLGAFRGTAMCCFDAKTTAPISPRPGTVLAGGGKC